MYLCTHYTYQKTKQCYHSKKLPHTLLSSHTLPQPRGTMDLFSILISVPFKYIIEMESSHI